MAKQNEKSTIILTGLVGSHSYGTATATSDYDYMSLAVGSLDAYFGTDNFGQSGTMEDGYDDPVKGFVEHKYFELRKAIDIGDVLEQGSCAVTRPTSFGERMPTAAVLSANFLENVRFGEREGGALQALFGLTLIEIVYQLLQGQVDEESLRPIIVNLVRQTM